MGKHLTSCEARKALVQKETGQFLQRPPQDTLNRIFGIKVRATYLPEYWIYLEMDGSADLEELDLFLRRTWVECCDHMSCFTINKVRYEATPFGGGPAPSLFSGFGGPKTKSMAAPVFRIFHPGLGFHYEYDYGSTTDLDLEVLWEREGPRHKPAVQVLSRNEAPAFSCVKCGKAGEFICPECFGEGESYCKKCIKKHPCGDDMALPVVNSPRMGVCGYDGPWEEGDGDQDDDEWDDDDEDGDEGEAEEMPAPGKKKAG